ncbi:MAG: hypothetical protein P9M14_12590 [Candidatus Alcyoniella australis]|nr:hypothetical protein [Candidatus Alcyoniella australis]
MSSEVKFNAKSRQASRRLLVLLETVEDFEQNLDLYVQDGGQIDEDFLPTLDRLRQLITEDSTELAGVLCEVSEPFQEGLLEWAVAYKRADMLEAWLSHADRSMAKVIKRLAHTLKTQGIQIEDRRERRSLKIEPEKLEAPPSLVSATDSQGEHVVWLARENPRGVRTLQAILSPQRGVANFDMYEVSRSEYRKMIREITVGDEFFITEAPTAYALYLLRRYVDIGQPPDRFITSLTMISSGIEPPADDPLLSTLPAPTDAIAAEVMRTSDRLHDLEPFKHFVPDRSAVMDLEHKLYNLEHSELMVDEQQRREQIGITLNKAIDDFFKSSAVIQRIRDMAALLHLMGRPEQRNLARATAELLESGECLPHTVPFALRTFSKIFTRWPLDAPEETEPEAGSESGGLIVAGR